jgi:hypothetical protein
VLLNASVIAFSTKKKYCSPGCPNEIRGGTRRISRRKGEVLLFIDNAGEIMLRDITR